jgi:hypothetical protein
MSRKVVCAKAALTERRPRKSGPCDTYIHLLDREDITTLDNRC